MPQLTIVLSSYCTKSSKAVVHSVAGGVGEGRSREADLGVGDVVDVVEPLEERHAVDEVESASRVTADVVHDKENVISCTANELIQLGIESHRSSFVTAANQVVLTARGHS